MWLQVRVRASVALATGTSRLGSVTVVMVTLAGSACTLDRAPSRLVDVGHIWFAQLV